MEAETRSHLSAASKRHHPALQSRYDYVIGGSDWGFLGLVDAYLGFEELDGGEDQPRPEFACPFCTEVFDVVGLCCHMDDEHPVESKNGVCPVCAARVGMDMIIEDMLILTLLSMLPSVVPCPLDQDREESARRSEFARQIVISTIFDET
ncbi:hypothetical protein MUK42_10909 [Musa troglodytarum]|uniref:Di19 zinc-binding domain-containing protein n=1 Tax=Musa troglodytarum TaxID=320322 RepID=A0A9E7GZY0_9LILI|nr:hypothetical protein MUK42_10909 [Musa troglodytarum]